jgi:hypothetical protein
MDGLEQGLRCPKISSCQLAKYRHFTHCPLNELLAVVPIPAIYSR